MKIISLNCVLTTTILLILIGETYLEDQYTNTNTFLLSMFNKKRFLLLGSLGAALTLVAHDFIEKRLKK